MDDRDMNSSDVYQQAFEIAISQGWDSMKAHQYAIAMVGRQSEQTTPTDHR